MDAIVLLKDQHKQVERLFKRLEKGDLEVVPEICAALTEHAELEEQYFYPAVREDLENAEDEVDEAFEEHHVMSVLIEELESMTPEDERYKAKATVLMELVRHHVEEEESELFPDARSELGRKRLQEIGDEMQTLMEAS